MPAPEVEGTPVTLDDEEVGLLKQLAEARKNKTDWEKIEKKAREELRTKVEANSTNTALTGSGAPAYHLTTSVRTGVDKAKLEALYPEVYAEVQTESVTTTLVIADEFKQ